MSENALHAILALVLLGTLVAASFVGTARSRNEANLSEQCLEQYEPCECACAGFAPKNVVFTECECMVEGSGL